MFDKIGDKIGVSSSYQRKARKFESSFNRNGESSEA